MTWRWVVGYEGYYEVSDLGEVRSVDRVIERGGRSALYRGRTRRQALSGNGLYLTVTLKRDGVSKTRTTHRLVAEAFLGDPPPGTECRHLNGNGHDNRAANLAWGTRLDNADDMRHHGTHANGAKESCPRGHPYSAENTYRWFDRRSQSTFRSCRACRRDNRSVA